MRWATVQPEELPTLPQLARRRAAEVPPSSPIDLNLAGPLALRAILEHTPLLRGAVRLSNSAAPGEGPARRRALGFYRAVLRRKAGL